MYNVIYDMLHCVFTFEPKHRYDRLSMTLAVFHDNYAHPLAALIFRFPVVAYDAVAVLLEQRNAAPTTRGAAPTASKSSKTLNCKTATRKNSPPSSTSTSPPIFFSLSSSWTRAPTRVFSS